MSHDYEPIDPLPHESNAILAFSLFTVINSTLWILTQTGNETLQNIGNGFLAFEAFIGGLLGLAFLAEKLSDHIEDRRPVDRRITVPLDALRPDEKITQPLYPQRNRRL